MQFAHCTGNLWNADDFSRCFQRDYLQILIPLIACTFSAIVLILQLLRKYRQARESNSSSKLPAQPIDNGYRYRDDPDDCYDEDDDEEEEDNREARGIEQDALMSLGLARGPTGNAPVVITSKPRGAVALALVEDVLVLVELGIHITLLITTSGGAKSRAAAIAGVAVWAYLFILVSLRLWSTITSAFSFSKIWYHTASLYGFLWVCTVLLFRSQLLHPDSQLVLALISTHFALHTVLMLIGISSRKGNRSVDLEYENDLEPSREPLASVLSLLSFSWVDAIVWKGYNKVYELPDVWNLSPKDKAAAVLANYYQVKKTTSLAWHLLSHFKRELLIQGAWAAISGVITFVPTLLLKLILEYVEGPEDTPTNAAWFYVVLLFATGVVTAVANGQGLWVGRRLCIRVKAIIVGELYAKALRRRAAAGTDKVLGDSSSKKKQDANNGEEQKQGLLKKALSLGRKGKKDKKADDADAESSSSSEDVAKKAIDDSQVSSGAIINLMAVDSFKVAELSAYLHFLWAETPVQFVLAIVLLYQILGYSSIVGMIMMALLLPVNMWVAKSFAAVQTKILAATDARIHTTNEVLTNIRIIKYFAWEQRFIGTVGEKRTVEMRFLRNRYMIWAAAATIWSGAPIVITFLTFAVYTLVEKKDLVPSIAFTALSLFSLLRIPLDQLADMIAHVQESKVSVDRVEEYLNEPETEKYQQLAAVELDENGEPLIGFDNVTCGWSAADDSDDFKMFDLNLRLAVGRMNVVIGPTGSGKTSLLMALLGEMSLMHGTIHLPGGSSREDLQPNPHTGLTESVAYCAQQAWLVNGTVRENILFASPWDARRYKNVIVACSLQRDLEILDAGDQTLVGEKGVTLSGGQKQRISLARALFSKARHVLLDDVLSAVDSHTAKWIFDKALMGPLMNGRTCVLVTHNASLCLPHAAFAVVLENGRVAAQGSAAEVITSGKIAEDMSKFERPASRPASALPSRVPSDVGLDTAADGLVHGHIKTVDPDAPSVGANTEGLARVVSKDISGIVKVNDNALQQEGKATGAVKLSVVFMYFRYMGGWVYWTIAALCFGAQQVSQVATNVWIRQWANAYTQHGTFNATELHAHSPVTHVRASVGSSYSCLRTGSCVWAIPSWTESSSGLHSLSTDSEVDTRYYLGVYAALGLAFMLVTLLREGVLFGGSLAASNRIHTQLIEAVTHAKFRFFDATPLGQIMNRFSKDVEAIDQEIAPVAVGVVHCMFSIITIVVLISSITPGFLIAAVFITILYFLIGKFYINSSRDLKRLESVQRSPLYQQFGETLTGMTTIRAYGDERRFVRDNLQRVNTHSRPFLYLWAANRWLAFRVDMVGALVSFSTAAFVIVNVGKVDAGAAGLAMTYAVTFTENVLWFVRLYASNEQNMNSVERIKEYLDVEQEAPAVIPENRPASSWPSQGAVTFIDYSTRYRKDFDFVLKKINFKILPGEKVGVVGRTGAGKSSLALALFRALEAEEGRIIIDDVDIGHIGLQDLRENVVMVPQDPTLFTGTIRSNLDPFGLFTDEDIFTVLRRVQLVGAPTPSSSAPTSRPDTPAQKGVGHSPATAVVVDQVLSSASTATANSPTVAISSSLILENKNIFRNLSSPVAEHGSNLSQGQRQLLCLARALLKEPKVLLMDEATASIDYATDSRIQGTIREIKNTTITIAHRLQTIIDYDKVLVLDQGEVIEFGDPFELISKADGSFRAMCETSGDFDVLEREAKKASTSRS